MKSCLAFILTVLSAFGYKAQNYPPAVGHPGTTAIHKDSSVFVNWASVCWVKRGFQDVSNPALGYASAGDSSMALGKALANGVLSLGDGGSALLQFPFLIANGPGFDFAVFENGFDDYFLELAFVEVSSDGLNFFRFPSHSLSDTLYQKTAFDSTNATLLNNLAGKYRAAYGTPFDLQELSGIPLLDVNAVSYVRIVDVVGSLLPQFAQRDAFHNKINDPWPTPFVSSGFDLDAVGVIHENRYLSSHTAIEEDTPLTLFPNPVLKHENCFIKTDTEVKRVRCYSFDGHQLWNIESPTSALPQFEQEGFYLLEVQIGEFLVRKRLVVK